VALLGTSGSGKSTLLNLIGGLDHPTSGALRVNGRDLSALTRDELSLHRRHTVSMIFQSFNLVPTMTAAENVSLSLMFAGVPRAERLTRGSPTARMRCMIAAVVGSSRFSDWTLIFT